MIPYILLSFAGGVAKNLGVSIPTLYRWVPASTHA